MGFILRWQRHRSDKSSFVIEHQWKTMFTWTFTNCNYLIEMLDYLNISIIKYKILKGVKQFGIQFWVWFKAWINFSLNFSSQFPNGMQIKINLQSIVGPNRMEQNKFPYRTIFPCIFCAPSVYKFKILPQKRLRDCINYSVPMKCIGCGEKKEPPMK